MKALWHRIFHKHWWAIGWGSTYKKTSHITWAFSPSSFNRPIIRWGRGPGGWFVIEWGNGNSDPAVSLGFQWGDNVED